MLAGIRESLAFLFTVKRKTNCSADGFLASNVYSLPVCFNNMLTDSKAKSAAGIVNIPPLVCTVKPFKHPWKVFFRNANAIIANLY